jgi:hypothetical protein
MKMCQDFGINTTGIEKKTIILTLRHVFSVTATEERNESLNENGVNPAKSRRRMSSGLRLREGNDGQYIIIYGEPLTNNAVLTNNETTTTTTTDGRKQIKNIQVIDIEKECNEACKKPKQTRDSEENGK